MTDTLPEGFVPRHGGDTAPSDNVEAVARAICVDADFDPDGPHPEDKAEGITDGFPMWVFYTSAARAAIAALAVQP